MRILVVGGDGRAHALAWKLAQNPTVDKIFATPGNGGIAEIAQCEAIDVTDATLVADFAESNGIDLTVVSPENLLAGGIADEFAARGLRCFGPSRAAARIESSKAWAGRLMARAGVPTARFGEFTQVREATAFLEQMTPPYVVKADGLAAGKGVRVCASRDEAIEAIRDCIERDAFGEAGHTVVIQEFLEGEELSVLCLTDGRTVLPLVEARDFKRALDGDRGPNTGGMGAFSPVPEVTPALTAEILSSILEPTVRALDAEGARFTGCLYAGLMLTAQGPRVYEFNCRFGDPEAQAVLPRLEGDLAELLLACAEGNLHAYEATWSSRACVTVVLASGGYPGSYRTGLAIEGLESAASDPDVTVFHAATQRRGDRLVTAGGRVLAVSALGDDLAGARERAYGAIDAVRFEGAVCRRDIAARAAAAQGAGR